MPKNDYQSWDKEKLIAEIKRLKEQKTYGLVWEPKTEEVIEKCKTELPILKEVKDKAISDPRNPKPDCSEPL